VFDYTIMQVMEERLASVRLVTYVPAPGTGTLKKLKELLGAAETMPIPGIPGPNL
jgi:hypothetical protein